MECTEVQESQKILIWTTLIIAARCNNLGLCSLQSDFLPVWLTFFLTFGHAHTSSSYEGQMCVVECADPSRCLSYLIRVVCS